MEENKTKQEYAGKARGFFNNLMGAEKNRANIEIYRIGSPIITPIRDNEKTISNNTVGDFVVILGDSVWITDTSEKQREQFVEASYSAAFVRLNPQIFKLQPESNKVKSII